MINEEKDNLKRKKVKKIIKDDSKNELCSNPDYYNKELKEIVIGWKNSSQVAEDIWGSIHQSLLSGKLVFAYRSNESSSNLLQIIIVINSNGTYSIGLITTGYSVLLPDMPKDYLSDVLLNDLKKFKIDKEILKIYEQIIED